MELQQELTTREIPYRFLDDEQYSNFFFERAERIRTEMPQLHEKVSYASRCTLRSYNGSDDFKAYVCPVKTKEGKRDGHPLLLTLCTWGETNQMLYWPEDMLPLSNEERHDIWYNFVIDDDVYYQCGDYSNRH